jgi:hypothetical protein
VQDRRQSVRETKKKVVALFGDKHNNKREYEIEERECKEREEKTKKSSLCNMKTNENMRKNMIGPCDFTKSYCARNKKKREKKVLPLFLELSHNTTQSHSTLVAHLHSSCALQLLGDGGDDGGETKHNQKKRKERGEKEWKMVHKKNG